MLLAPNLAENVLTAHTCSPVSLCFASLTLPMLPAPIVLPSAHVPVLGAVIVVLLFCTGTGCPPLAVSVATPLVGIALAVEASEAYREWRLLDSVRCGGASRDSLCRDGE
jgi:hypothetical protein